MWYTRTTRLQIILAEHDTFTTSEPKSLAKDCYQTLRKSLSRRSTKPIDQYQVCKHFCTRCWGVGHQAGQALQVVSAWMLANAPHSREERTRRVTDVKMALQPHHNQNTQLRHTPQLQPQLQPQSATQHNIKYDWLLHQPFATSTTTTNVRTTAMVVKLRTQAGKDSHRGICVDRPVCGLSLCLPGN